MAAQQKDSGFDLPVSGAAKLHSMLQHHTQRHQSLADWQRMRKERQRLSPSLCHLHSRMMTLLRGTVMFGAGRVY